MASPVTEYRKNGCYTRTKELVPHQVPIIIMNRKSRKSDRTKKQSRREVGASQKEAGVDLAEG